MPLPARQERGKSEGTEEAEGGSLKFSTIWMRASECFFILHTYDGGSEMCRNERVEEVGGNNGCMWGGGGRGFTQGQLQNLGQFQLFISLITEERKGSLL